MGIRIFVMVGLCWLCAFPLSGREQGKPFVRNYTSKEYQAHTQNWAIVQDHKGMMYFGNTYGVLQYDGTSWRLVRLPNRSAVRSLGISSEGRLYVGGIGEFGYLEPDAGGQYRYHSLSDSLPPEQRVFMDVWSLHVQGREVYFHTSRFLFTYARGKVSAEPLRQAYHRAFVVEGELYLRQDSLGLGHLRWGNWEPIAGGEAFGGQPISAMLPYREGEILIGTRDGRLLLMEHAVGQPGGPMRPFPESPLTRWLRRYQLYHAIRLRNGNFAFATLGGGVAVATPAGQLLQVLDTRNGLRNSRAYYLCQGEDGALWIAMDNGIAHAEINSPLTRWDGQSGLPGTIYAIARHEGRLYAGGGDGLFSLQESADGGYEFSRVGDFPDQVWKLLPTPYGLMVGTREGLMRLEGKRLVRAFPDRSLVFEVAYFPKSHPGKLFLGLEEGAAILAWDGKQWKLHDRIESAGSQVRSLTLEGTSTLWMGTRYHGVMQATLSEGGRVENIRTYGKSDGLPAEHQVHVARVSGHVLFSTPFGISRFVHEKGRFEPASAIDRRFVDRGIGALRIAEDSLGNIWMHAVEEGEGREWMEVGIRYPDGSYQIDSVTLKRLSETELYCIYPDQEQITWIGGADGLFRYDNRVHESGNAPFHAIIRQVWLANDSLAFQGNYPLSYAIVGEDRYLQESPPAMEIPFSLRSVTFRFAAPSYENEAGNRFSCWLSGYDPGWGEWQHDTRKSYFDLPPGEYVFYVRARNIYDQQSTVASYRFTVLKPWYMKAWALALALALGMLMAWGIARAYAWRISRDKMRLEKVVWERTAQVRAQKEEIEANQLEMAQQQQEIASQRDRLAASVENMRQLSAIGLEIASMLSVEGLVASTRRQLGQLLDFTAFGIGFYNEKKQCIEFPDAIAEERRLPNFEYPLSDRQHLAVYCFLRQEEILIADFDAERHHYRNEAGESLVASDQAQSVIYLPLLVKGNPVGVVTVQHHRKHAFDAYHFGLLKNLAVYLAIAVEHAEAYFLMAQQSQQIEATSQELQDSIAYAQRIQQAMLPKMEQIYLHLPDSFVLLRPRNVVSGDFHWFATKRDILGNTKVIIAAVDCTGHGVPGAFMSTIGNDLLSEIVHSRGILEADRILNELHLLVRQALSQEETGNNDGMDMALCAIDFAKGRLEFAGAKSPLVYVQQGQLHEIPGDNASVGGQQREYERKFTKHTVQLHPEEETAFYLFSDGFQDQFGGHRRRKFTSKRFRELLLQVHQAPVEEQQRLLEEALVQWMGGEAQVDDVLVIGFRA